MKKKVFLGVLLTAMFTFCACGSSESEENTPHINISESDQGAVGRHRKDHSFIENDNSSIRYTNAEDALPLELTETGCYRTRILSSYMRFYGFIKNPNDYMVANYPYLTITVKDENGNIIAYNNYTGTSFIMPNDEVFLTGLVELPEGIRTTSQLSFEYAIKCDRFTNKSLQNLLFYTTDFSITNVTGEKAEDGDFHVTGEVTNTYKKDCQKIYLSAIFRKDGEITHVEWSELKDLKSHTTKIFDINCYDDILIYDEIEVRVHAR